MKVKHKTLTQFITIVTVSLLLGTMFLSIAQASPSAQEPRPPVNDGNGGGGGDVSNSGGDGGSHGNEIFGVVTDITTGQPGGGLTVCINNNLFHTDAAGTYSFTGVAVQPGEYVISLELPSEFTPAHPLKKINLTGGRVRVDLQYYSGPQPTSTTPTTVATTTPTPIATTTPIPVATSTSTPPPAVVTATATMVVVDSSPTITPNPVSAEEFVPPSSDTPEAQLSITSTLAIVGDSPNDPPDTLPVTGNKEGIQGTPPTTLPATGFSSILLLIGLGLGGLTFLTRHLRFLRHDK